MAAIPDSDRVRDLDSSENYSFISKQRNIRERKRICIGASIYPEDLESSFPTEAIHFSELLKTELGEKKTGTEKVAMELNMYHLITENALEGCFPNTEIALSVYLTIMVTNCTGERSFSKLRRIKDAQRSTMSQNRLNNLTLMSIEYELLRKLRHFRNH